MTDVTSGQDQPSMGPAKGTITLAEIDGQVWLVGGEEHLDDLLIGALPDGVALELVTRTTRAEVWSLWDELTPEKGDSQQPWILNPALTRGLLGRLGLGRNEVRFAAWSAAVDEAGLRAVESAAAWLAANAGGRLMLRQAVPADAPPGTAEIQRVRAQLVRAALHRAGVPDAAIGEEPAEEASSGDAMLIAMVPPS